MITNSAPIARIAIHAPARNFVTTHDDQHGAGAHEADGVDHPRPHHLAAHRGSVSVRSSRVQCRTMPIWLSVNDTNTPTM